MLNAVSLFHTKADIFPLFVRLTTIQEWHRDRKGGDDVNIEPEIYQSRKAAPCVEPIEPFKETALTQNGIDF